MFALRPKDSLLIFEIINKEDEKQVYSASTAGVILMSTRNKCLHGVYMMSFLFMIPGVFSSSTSGSMSSGQK